MPAVRDGWIGLVETENAGLPFQSLLRYRLRSKLLRKFGPEADDSPAGVADWPDQPAGKPGIGQEIRGPNLVGRKTIAKQAVPDWLGRGEVPKRQLVQFPQVKPPLV